MPEQKKGAADETAPQQHEPAARSQPAMPNELKDSTKTKKIHTRRRTMGNPTDSRTAATNQLDLGISAAELREQVIDRAADKLRDSIDRGDYSHLHHIVKDATDVAVSRHIEATVVPLIQSQIETITFQATNSWGEPRDGKLTFREYLVQRAEKWLREEVNYEGKPKGTDSFSWKPHQTRVAHMIHQHLHYHIERAVKDMLATANAQIVGGIEQTVKLKLAEIQTALTIKSDVKGR